MNSKVTSIKAWNEKSIDISDQLVTQRLWQSADGTPSGSLESTVTGSTRGANGDAKPMLVSPLDVLDAMRKLDEHMERAREARASMAQMLSKALGQEIFNT